jgi:hypothetical protein
MELLFDRINLKSLILGGEHQNFIQAFVSGIVLEDLLQALMIYVEAKLQQCELELQNHVEPHPCPEAGDDLEMSFQDTEEADFHGFWKLFKKTMAASGPKFLEPLETEKTLESIKMILK